VETPTVNNQQLTRAVTLGAVAAAALIGLFLLTYWVLSALDAAPSIRLFGALLLPPALLGGVLAFIAQRRK
jgi:hypothetical protein